MALKQANMVKRIIGSGGGFLEARAGESFRIKRIECVPSASDTYLTVAVDRVTVAFYRVQGKSGNHLGTLHGIYQKGNIMDFLTKQGINVSIPVPSGQTLSVSRYAEPGNVILVYDRYDEGDVKVTDPNGPECKEYTFLQYAEIGAVPIVAGDYLVDTSLTPAEFPNFPCAAVVPANYSIEMLGIAGGPVCGADATPGTLGTTFLKMLRDREVLFDPDRNGIPFDANDDTLIANSRLAMFSLIGPGTETLLDVPLITPGDPLMLIPPLVFAAGVELNVYLSIAESGTPTAVWNAHDDDEVFILRVKRV